MSFFRHISIHSIMFLPHELKGLTYTYITRQAFFPHFVYSSAHSVPLLPHLSTLFTYLALNYNAFQIFNVLRICLGFVFADNELIGKLTNISGVEGFHRILCFVYEAHLSNTISIVGRIIKKFTKLKRTGYQPDADKVPEVSWYPNIQNH